MNKLENLDLNLCLTFLTVAKSGSISKAANELYVSQPAISYNIKILEERLNCKLFNRTAKGVELTAEATKLMYYVENAYNTLQTGFKMLNDSNDLLQGEIKIGVPTHICIFLVSDIIESFNAKYPGIKFSIVNRSTSEMIDMLERRELDIIIDNYPVYSSREDISILDLIEIDNTFVASNKYSNLIKDNNRISVNELKKYPLLLHPEKTSTRKELEEMMQQNSYSKFNPNIEVATTEVMLELVKKGLGIGYFARMSIAELIRTGELIEIPVKEKLPKTKICMVYIKELLTNAPKKFINIIKEKTDMLKSLKEKNIRLILLQDCMYKCEICHSEGIKNKKINLLSPKDIQYMYKVINKNYGISTVHLTGGDPLLKKNLEDIILCLKEERATVKMTTNGYLLDENMWIGKLIDKINISVYSIDKQQYEKISGIKGSYDRVMNAIKELRFKYPTLKICINTVFMKNINDQIEDIEALIKFTMSIKADLKFIEIYPDSLKEFVSIEKIVQKIKKLGYKNTSSNFREQIYSKGDHNVYIQKCSCSAISKMKDKEKECRENNDFYITQDGAINLCRKSEKIVNLYDMIKNRKDEELVKTIKEVYNVMGNGCKC